MDDVELHQDSDEAELLFHTTSAVLDGDEPKAPGENLESDSIVFQGRKPLCDSCSPSRGEDAFLREYPGAESYGPYVAVGGATGKDGGFSR